MSLFQALFSDSFAGQVLYRVSGRRWCKPVFETDSYAIPDKYLVKTKKATLASADFVSDKETASSTDSLYDSVILVDWDGPSDSANPQNWPFARKFIVAAVMAICTASLYMGSALFTPAEDELVAFFGTTKVKVTLGLSMFVWGYGISSLCMGPMSENPLFGGRLYLYLVSQFVFTCLQIPAALSNHIAPFVVLRFLAGFMAAPPLSTGPATYADIFGFPSVVYAIIVWSVGAIMGPFVSPLIGGALVQNNSWRWAFWFLLILSASVLLLMLVAFPETSEQAILMKKAHSLRRQTGNPNILAPGDIRLRTQSASEVLRHILWQPMKLTIQEPVLLLMDIHLGLMYAVMYLYFEAVPIVYGGVYGFNLVQQGLAYLSLLIGCCLTALGYVPYLHFGLVTPTLKGRSPDVFHVFGNVAITAAIQAPIGVLIFGWCAHNHIHWSVSMVVNLFFGGGVWLMFKAYLSFIANLYPPSLTASAYASNGAARAVLAAAFPLFARPMYDTLAIRGFPVGWGCSLLTFICIPLIGLPVYLRMRGRTLHERALEKYGRH